MDLVFDHFGQIGKEQVRFIEEEHQLGLLRIAHFRQPFKEFAEQPQQEGGVELGRIDEFIGSQNIDHAITLGIGLQQVIQVERRLPQELVRPLLLERQQAALHGAHAGGGDVAVLGLKLFGMRAHVLQHRLQVFEIEQQQPLVIGDFENGCQHACLGVVQVEQAAKEQGTHIGHGRPDRMPLLAKHIPEGYRTA